MVLSKNRILYFSIVLYVLSTICLELNFGIGVINVGNLIAFVGSIIACALATIAIGANKTFGLFKNRTFIFSSLIGVFYLLSCFWSVSPVNSFVQSVYFFTFLVTAYVLSKNDYRLLIRIILNLGFLVGLLSLCALILNSHYALQPHQSTFMPELRGVFKHQQRLGLFECSVLGLAVIAHIKRDSQIFTGPILQFKLFFIFFISFIVIFSFARLFMLFSVLALLFSIFLAKNKSLRYFIFITFVFISILAYFQGIADYAYQSYQDGDLSLTGRILIWERTLLLASQSPVIGLGFGVFNEPYFDYIWSAFYRPPHAHNSFIQAYFDIGLLGLLLFMILIVIHYKMVIKETEGSRCFDFYVAFIFYQTLICGLTGVTYAGKPSIIYSLLFIFIAIKQNVVKGRNASPFD